VPDGFPPTGGGFTGGGTSFGLLILAGLAAFATGLAFVAIGARRREEEVPERVRSDDR